MKRLLLALVLLAGVDASAQPFIRFYPPNGPATFNGSLTITGTGSQLLLPDGSVTVPSIASATVPGSGWRISSGTWIYVAGSSSLLALTTNGPQLSAGQSLRWTDTVGGPAGTVDLMLHRDAANTLALRNGTSAQTFNLYNTYTDGSNYERGGFKWNSNFLEIFAEAGGTGTVRHAYLNASTKTRTLYPTAADAYSLGDGPTPYGYLYVSRSIQGSKVKALTDNTLVSIFRLTVPDDDGIAGTIHWSNFAEDADTDARQIFRGDTNFVCLNNSGTITCTFATGTGQVTQVTAGTLTTPTGFVTTGGTTTTIDIQWRIDSSLDAAAETLNFFWRLDLLTPTTVTPL